MFPDAVIRGDLAAVEALGPITPQIVQTAVVYGIDNIAEYCAHGLTSDPSHKFEFMALLQHASLSGNIYLTIMCHSRMHRYMSTDDYWEYFAIAAEMGRLELVKWYMRTRTFPAHRFPYLIKWTYKFGHPGVAMYLAMRQPNPHKNMRHAIYCVMREKHSRPVSWYRARKKYNNMIKNE